MPLSSDWKFLMFVAGTIVIGLLAGGLAASHGADLPIPRKHIVKVEVKREKQPIPVYDPNYLPKSAPVLDRPAGVP